jgi:hypothetical protein
MDEDEQVYQKKANEIGKTICGCLANLQFKPKNPGYFLKSFRRRMGKSFPLQNC